MKLNEWRVKKDDSTAKVVVFSEWKTSGPTVARVFWQSK
jgi:hypothetical protein